MPHHAPHHHQAESSFPSMLRRCSRLQSSHVQTLQPFSIPADQVRRAIESSCGTRPHVAQAGDTMSWSICTFFTDSPSFRA